MLKTINVTKTDIAKAFKLRVAVAPERLSICYRCPVALALQRYMKNKNISVAWPNVYYNSVCIASNLPQEAHTVQIAFDNWWHYTTETKPTSFKYDLDKLKTAIVALTK